MHFVLNGCRPGLEIILPALFSHGQGPQLIEALLIPLTVLLLHELGDEVLDHLLRSLGLPDAVALAIIASRAAISSPMAAISAASCWMSAMSLAYSAVSSSDSSVFESRVCLFVVSSVSQKPL